MASEYKVDDKWYRMLTEGESGIRRFRHVLGLLPSSPRCKICNSPFKGVGGTLMHMLGRDQSRYNPRYCEPCGQFENPGGAEVILTMLFADVRGSTALAEQMTPLEFSGLMNRFYAVATDVLVRTDAMVDRLVGDEVIGLYIPGMAGQEHARKAIKAAQNLLHLTGHRDRKGPWIPVGVGVHTGIAFVGVVGGGQDNPTDFTALGDNVNITARLASKAGQGEVIISEDTYNAAQIRNEGLEKRDLELKGKSESVSVRVLHAR
jgi:adenylate cyclase